ncbi:MAG: hypothetical protein R3A13_04020 [Bdellovibrionota bacterium]
MAKARLKRTKKFSVGQTAVSSAVREQKPKLQFSTDGKLATESKEDASVQPDPKLELVDIVDTVEAGRTRKNLDGSIYKFKKNEEVDKRDFRLDFQSHDVTLRRRNILKPKNSEDKNKKQIDPKFIGQQFSEEEITEQELFSFIQKMSIPDDQKQDERDRFCCEDAGLLKVGTPEELIAKFNKWLATNVFIISLFRFV